MLGDPVKKEIDRMQKIVDKINEIEESYQSLSDDEIKSKTSEFKSRIKDGQSLDDILPEAFAVIKNVCRRLCGKKFKVLNNEEEWNMIPYDVQMIGGIVLHEGKIAEMKTGEGKTLVANFAIYLNALSGKGVHVITVNDFLARRDSEWMSPIFDFLEVSSGIIVHGVLNEDRRKAYSADITYGTNNEFGFDFLRDGMVADSSLMVQRELNYAIVDEVDSILIDESRTPLIISQPAEESTDKYKRYASLVRSLQKDDHYNIDEKQKNATLTEEGIRKMEEILGVENIYVDAGIEEVRHIEQALRAEFCFHKDEDYVVSDNAEVVIVDEFTGRLMEGRRYSEGLHQAIEAKEKVEVKRESKTMATITFQNYFRIYEKLAGMTGTAMTEAEEFGKIYKLEVLPIPTHRPLKRKDLKDLVFKNEYGKFTAIARIVKEKHEKGQPVLIGTISIEKSEALSSFLKKEGIPHAILNAKHHEKESEIVSKAGQKGAVTIATNMAGRGTDIKLGEGVEELGGFCILGSERHESRRIDNQLRGRAGRQGDSGESQFYVSLADPLMRLFGSDRLQSLMTTLKVPEDMPLESRIVSGAIESAQKKVEGRNFDIRKHLVDYDDVVNKHREIISKKRKKVLNSDNIHEDILDMIENIVRSVVLKNCQGKPHQWDKKEIYENISAIHNDEKVFHSEDIEKMEDTEEIKKYCLEFLLSALGEKKNSLPSPDEFSQVERAVLLRTIDYLWPEHLDAMSHLRETVSFSGYAQKDPLTEYKSEGYYRAESLLTDIEDKAINMLFKVKINIQIPLARKIIRKTTTNEGEIEEGGTAGFRKKIKTGTIKKTSDEEIGRNDLCPCGSGKKYKKCCGK